MALSKEKQQQIHETRKKQILDAAMELFDTHGYTDTKISDIAAKADISKGLVYRYFKSKEDILYALSENIEHCFQDCAEQTSAKEGLRLFGLRLLSYPYYQDYIPPFRVFFTAALKDNIDSSKLQVPITEESMVDYFSKLFRRGQEDGEFRTGDPVLFGDVYFKYLIGSLISMNPGKSGQTYHPDIDLILSLFE